MHYEFKVVIETDSDTKLFEYTPEEINATLHGNTDGLAPDPEKITVTRVYPNWDGPDPAI